MASYLEKWKQRTNGSCSNFDGIYSGVPQGSILGPLTICDLRITSNSDDSTSHTFSSDLDVAMKKLKSYTIKIFDGFITIA